MRASQPLIRKARESNKSTSPESFVDQAVAVRFLSLPPRHIKQRAWEGEIPAHSIGLARREIWTFRLSEIAGFCA